MTDGHNQESDLANELCLECGLCCNGSIFSHVELDEDDCARLGLDHEADPSLAFPCQHLSGKRCTVYEKRPRICSSYRCKTLSNLEKGKIEYATALEIIRKAAKSGRKFEDAIPAGITRKQAIICVAKNQCPKEASEKEFQRLRLAYVALQALVDRYMRRKGEAVIRSPMRGD